MKDKLCDRFGKIHLVQCPLTMKYFLFFKRYILPLIFLYLYCQNALIKIRDHIVNIPEELTTKNYYYYFLYIAYKNIIVGNENNIP